jgi:hypothetical protein
MKDLLSEPCTVCKGKKLVPGKIKVRKVNRFDGTIWIFHSCIQCGREIQQPNMKKKKLTELFSKAECEHIRTEELNHEFFPTKIVCLDCNKTINGNWVGNTNVGEFESE